VENKRPFIYRGLEKLSSGSDVRVEHKEQIRLPVFQIFFDNLPKFYCCFVGGLSALDPYPSHLL
jgi:hypothetical protein